MRTRIRLALIGGMGDTHAMQATAMIPRAGDLTIRDDLRAGDLGAIATLHGTIYAAEHGLDARFEAGVARGLADAVERGWPVRGRLWAVERNGELAGSLGLTDEGDGVGKVRWFLLVDELRGGGLGRALLEELIGEAEEAGLATLRLETFSALRAAAHLYRSLGFELTDSQRFSGWGRPIVLQHYERRAT
jgi:GNAT superfamily N-acetyltransferase